MPHVNGWAAANIFEGTQGYPRYADDRVDGGPGARESAACRAATPSWRSHAYRSSCGAKSACCSGLVNPQKKRIEKPTTTVD